MITENNGFLTVDYRNPLLEKVMENHVIQRHGSSLLFRHHADGKVACVFKPFDNTVFICDPSGFVLAEQLGTKRFILGAARTHTPTDAIRFPRDLSFPLQPDCTNNEPAFPCASLKGLTANDPLIHDKLTQMLGEHADFTPAKMDEYKKGGDAFCRFNLESEDIRFGVFSKHIFLLNKESNEIVGMIVADIIVSPEGPIDIYFRDEVVKQPGTLKDLFAAARQEVNNDLKSKHIDPRKHTIHAFIRAPGNNIENYIALGCSQSNTSNYVIHGPITPFAHALDEYMKQRCLPAPQNLLLHQFRPWLKVGAVAIAAAAIAYGVKNKLS